MKPRHDRAAWGCRGESAGSGGEGRQRRAAPSHCPALRAAARARHTSVLRERAGPRLLRTRWALLTKRVTERRRAARTEPQQRHRHCKAQSGAVELHCRCGKRGGNGGQMGFPDPNTARSVHPSCPRLEENPRRDLFSIYERG